MLEENIENSVTENTAGTVEAENKETVVDDYIAPSKEQFDKEIQRARVAAKGELLKELGIHSVNEFKEAQKQREEAYNAWTNEKETLMNEKETLSKSLSEREKDIDALKEDNALIKAGVSDEYRDDVITLARAKAGENKDFATAVDEILIKNPTWRKGSREPLRMGTEKSEFDSEKASKQEQQDIRRLFNLK